ncbi:MAG: hypothetical protein KAG37_00270 [Flavobacteriales bacterium]|nr:hypothetical protein [Flavobacteriales bacterium]
MKKVYMLLLVFISLNAFSQSTHLNYERYLIAGDQASSIIDDYLNPAMVGMMNTASSGWYTTAKTHKRFGFDINIGVVGAFIPDEDLTFDISKYDNITVAGGQKMMPTILGTKDESPEITSSIFQGKMNGPNGTGIDPAVAPSPTVQAGIGIGWGTEIKVRFLPKVGVKGYKYGMWGVALQHDVAQYIPVVKKLPVSISVLGGFSKASATWTFNADDNQWDGSNQHTDFEVQNYTFQLLASTNIPIINAYGGIGYNSSKSSYKMYGEYIIDDNINTPTTLTDPADGDWKSSGMTGTLGVRLSIAFFKIYADYTWKEYNTASAGIAFSFR